MSIKRRHGRITDGFGKATLVIAPSPKPGDTMLDFDAVRRAEPATEPFPHMIGTRLLSANALAGIARDFPPIRDPGVFPLDALSFGPRFAELIEDIRSETLEHLIGEKLGVDLSELPLMITVRGWCHRKDGRIHTDSTDKAVTCLLYLNETWDQDGGRLRLLRAPTDIDDVVAEVPPDGGTLVAFKRTDNSWHGHLPFEGPRRYVMFNWVRSAAALRRNVLRHRVSAGLKRLNPFR